MRACPYCAEQIQDAAIICRFCGRSVTPVSPPATEASADPPAHGQPSEGSPPASAAPESAAPAGTPGADPPTPSLGSTWPPTPESSGQPALEPALVPTPVPVVGQGAHRFSHSGVRYILGYGQDFFGIWDRNVPGPPTFSFPRTDAGWHEAWNRFAALEPRAMAVPNLVAPPGGAGPVGAVSVQDYRSGHVLSLWIVAGLIASAITSIVTIAVRASYISAVDDVRNDVPGAVDHANSVLDATRAVSSVGLLIIVVIAVLWVIWQYRGQKNVRALGAANLRFAPGWVVGWWFIPVANYAMPYLTMRELYKASDPDAGAVEWAAMATPILLPLWWAACLLRQILAVAAATVTSGDTRGTIEHINHVIAAESLLITAEVALTVAAILAILLVRRIDQRQEWKRVRATAYEQAVANA